MAEVLVLQQPSASYGTPQVEDGYTKIANELLEAIIRFDFSKRQWNVLFFVIRKTYGYNKKRDDMSLSQITNGTGLDTGHVSKTISELVAMKVLLKQQGQYAQSLAVNKNYGEWIGLPKQQGVAKTANKGCQNGKLLLPKQQPQKTTPKENTKESKFVLPDFIPQDAWDGFLVMRKAIKKPMTDRARTMLINKLKTFHANGLNVGAILDKSTVNNWQDVYEDKQQTKKPDTTLKDWI